MYTPMGLYSGCIHGTVSSLPLIGGRGVIFTKDGWEAGFIFAVYDQPFDPMKC